jgi:hypothetical protein
VSEEPTLGERQTAVVTDDEVIEHADIHQRERVAQSARDEFVGLAGLGDTGRMVVREDERGGVVLQGLRTDLARMNAGAVDGCRGTLPSK